MSEEMKRGLHEVADAPVDTEEIGEEAIEAAEEVADVAEVIEAAEAAAVAAAVQDAIVEEDPADASAEEGTDADGENPTSAETDAADAADAADTITPAPKKKHTAVKVVVGILAVLALVAGAGYGYYHDKISRLQFDDGTSVIDGTIDETDQTVVDMAAEMANNTADLEQLPPILPPEPEMPFDSNVVNILLLGTDERSKEFTDAARSDTIILCSINTDTGAIKLFSIERAMGAPVLEGRYQGEWDWITHIFRYGGADLMMKTVNYCFNMDVQYYVRVNFNTFIQLVDSMGGVTLTFNQKETDHLNNNLIAYNPDLATPVHVGENHVNGWTALQYARTRKIDSDWVRVQRQRITIGAIMEQAKTLSVTELDQVLNDVLPLIMTNLTEEEITALLLKVPLFLDTMDIEGITIPVQGTYGSMSGMGGRSLYSADFAANAQIMYDMIYGTDEDEADAEGQTD